MQAREPVAPRRWIRHAVVFPLVTVVSAVASEANGLTGIFALTLCFGLWLMFLRRSLYRDRAQRTQAVPRIVGGVVAALWIVLLRPAAPERVPFNLADVVFREWLEGCDRDQTYFLEVDGKDATPELLQRLADLGLNLKPRSAAMVRELDGSEREKNQGAERARKAEVTDKDSGERGTLLRTGRFTRGAAMVLLLEIEVVGYTGIAAESGRRFLVMRLGRWWIMRSEKFFVALQSMRS